MGEETWMKDVENADKFGHLRNRAGAFETPVGAKGIGHVDVQVDEDDENPAGSFETPRDGNPSIGDKKE